MFRRNVTLEHDQICLTELQDKVMTDLLFLTIWETQLTSSHISSAELSVIFPTQICLTMQKAPQAASEV